MFTWLDHIATLIVENWLGIEISSALGGSLHFFIDDTIKILILLSGMIFIISYLRSYFQPQKTKAMLEKIKGPKAHLAASLMGIITLFSSCSSIPIFGGHHSVPPEN